MALALYGWYKIKHFNTENTGEIVNISLLIPFRNEEKNLPKLLESLKRQTILPVEIIFIDDHSSDRGPEIILDARQALPVITILKNSGKHGKKTALITGLKTAKGDWVIQTDADCIFAEKWIESYVLHIQQNKNTVMISAPVQYTKGRSFFSWFFELDFLSLVFTGAGYIGAGKPAFCNGANMAYSRDEALKLSDPYFIKTVSGDDVFLIQQLAATNKNRISFLKNKEAIVKTTPPESLQQFLMQRVRWGSKTKHYKAGFAKFVAVIVFASNLILLLLWVLAITGVSQCTYTLAFTGIKFICDSLILVPALLFFGSNWLIFMFLPAAVLYPFYLIISSTGSMFLESRWKE